MSIEDKFKVLEFKDFGDERGNLVVIEGNTQIPFEIKRVFYIYGSDEKVVRGQYANKKTEFVFINVRGTSKIRINDGHEEKIIELNRPKMGLYLSPMLWKEMYDFSSDSVLIVLANTHYDDNEYIRNYDEYISNINK